MGGTKKKDEQDSDGGTKQAEKDEKSQENKNQDSLEDAAKQAGLKSVSLSKDQDLMLKFLKKVLGSCPYNVRVEFVRRFKARYGNSEKRAIMLETVKQFGDTMRAFV